MQRWEIIYQYEPLPESKKVKPFPRKRFNLYKHLAMGLIAISVGGMVGPLTPMIRMESGYLQKRVQTAISSQLSAVNQTNTPLPASVPVVFNPLVTEDGKSIDPINKNFSLIIPKVGINAAIIPAVNPANPGEYLDALKKGIAHASTSFFPDENGTVYLFSHSTNYDWFVKDLNAVFYLLKNLDTGDLVVVFYKGKRYTYKLTEKRVVAPSDISYLIPQPGNKRLILQTCWPPGSTTERLLIFADLVEEQTEAI